MGETGTWNEWRIHIVKELERQDNNLRALLERFDEFERSCIESKGKQHTINTLTRYKLYLIFGAISLGINTLWSIAFWYFTH